MLEYVIDSAGTVTECAAHTEGFLARGAKGLELRDGCSAIRQLAPYQPPRDAAQNAVDRRYRIGMDIKLEDMSASGLAPK